MCQKNILQRLSLATLTVVNICEWCLNLEPFQNYKKVFN